MSDLYWEPGTFSTAKKAADSLIGRPKELSPEERQRAALTVAANAQDAEECAEFLAMLGLTAAEGRTEASAA